jgi:hypothetical protein
MTTPRGAPELVSAQAVPETTVNEQIRRTEAGAARYPVADRVTAPPGTSADGATYLIIATATGAFAGKENQLATSVGVNAANGWYYRTLGTIDEGATAYVQDENAVYLWGGASWAIDSSAVTYASAAEVRTGTEAGKSLSPDNVFDAAAYVALNDSGGNIAVDFATGFNFTMTMDGDYTLSAPTNGKPGQTGCIVLTQDGTGTQTLAYNAAWKFAGGTDPVLSTAASTVDILFYHVLPNGTDVFANLVKGVA